MTTCYNLERKIFFIHIPKCAGSSVGGWVHPKTGEWSGSWLEKVLPGGWSRQGLPNGHQPVRAIEAWTGRPVEWWDLILATVRNPFEQQISQYRFWRRRAWFSASQMHGSHPDDLNAMAHTFDEWVQLPYSLGPNQITGTAGATLAGGYYRWYLIDDNQEIPPNVAVVPSERLREGLCEALRLFEPKDEPVDEVNAADAPLSGSWQDWYSPGGAAAVQHKFAWSIATYYPELRSFQGVANYEPTLQQRFPELVKA